ncbi:hypothetical protein FOZ63_018433, partial [Perkinsus olseni]
MSSAQPRELRLRRQSQQRPPVDQVLTNPSAAGLNEPSSHGELQPAAASGASSPSSGQGLPAQERQSSHQPPRPAAPEPPVQVVRPTEAFAEPVLPAFSEELAHPVRAIAPDQQ